MEEGKNINVYKEERGRGRMAGISENGKLGRSKSKRYIERGCDDGRLKA